MNEILRSVPVVGATALIQHMWRGGGRILPWLQALIAGRAHKACGSGAGRQAGPHGLEADGQGELTVPSAPPIQSLFCRESAKSLVPSARSTRR